MRLRFVLPSLVMALVFAGAVGTRADDPGAGSQTNPTVEQTPAQQHQAVGIAESAALVRVHEILGTSVENRQGDNLGKIEDLVFDSKDGKIRFCVVSYGGMLGIGSKLTAVPYHDVALPSASDQKSRVAYLEISKADLAKAPSFAGSSWPDMTNADWVRNTEKFFKEASMATRMPTERR